MSKYFAEIKDGNVLRVIVVDDKDATTEESGINYCKNLLGGKWVQTSYNGTIRKQYAGKGFKYDKEKDIFISPKPYESWSIDDKGDWNAPIKQPEVPSVWNEKEQAWEVDNERISRTDS